MNGTVDLGTTKMATIVDRRGSEAATGSSKKNRQKFVEKNKSYIRKKVMDTLRNKSIENLSNQDELGIDFDNDIEERSFDYDRSTGGIGDFHLIHRENKKYNRGDQVDIPQDMGGGGRGSGSPSDEAAEDAFEFVLTKKEFTNILFDGLELPNFNKLGESIEVEKKLMRAGYSKEGIPARLDIFKTVEMAIARRLAQKKKKNVAFLDEEDLRYRHYSYRDVPCRVAHVYFMMDVSGSVNQDQKDLSKRFFLLYYMFLKSKYDKVGITFIRYHSEAQVCSERDFFYSKETGGTHVAEAYRTLKEDMDKNRCPDKENIYIAHSSDGDLGFHEDPADLTNVLTTDIFPNVQHIAYIDVPVDSGMTPLMRTMVVVDPTESKIGKAVIRKVEDTLTAIRLLFRKRRGL